MLSHQRGLTDFYFFKDTLQRTNVPGTKEALIIIFYQSMPLFKVNMSVQKSVAVAANRYLMSETSATLVRKPVSSKPTSHFLKNRSVF